MENSKCWAAFIAGDANIFFPALVSLVSLEEQNPGIFDRFIIFDADMKNPAMDRLLERYGIAFIDSKSVRFSDMALSMKKMHEKQWPVEVFLNWVMPEHFHALGYKYSLKLDYDTLSIGKFSTRNFEENSFFASALPTERSTYLPEGAIRRVESELGMNARHSRSYNVGVMPFNNSYASEFGLFGRFRDLYVILAEECEKLGALEEVCFAALAKNMDGVIPLHFCLNFRVKSIRKTTPKFTTDISVLHYIRELKPWRALAPEQLVQFVERREPMFPFYRIVWLDYASKIDGFATFCDQRPYSVIEIMCMANSILFAERVLLEKAGNPPHS